MRLLAVSATPASGPNVVSQYATGDYVNGLNLYRANMPAPFLAPGATLAETTVPVQVLVPRKDIFVTPALQRLHRFDPVGQQGRSDRGRPLGGDRTSRRHRAFG